MTRHESTADAPPEPLLSINDVCRWLAVGRDTVYALVWRGELEPVRVGERNRFLPAEVRDYLEEVAATPLEQPLRPGDRRVARQGG